MVKVVLSYETAGGSLIPLAVDGSADLVHLVAERMLGDLRKPDPLDRFLSMLESAQPPAKRRRASATSQAAQL